MEKKLDHWCRELGRVVFELTMFRVKRRVFKSSLLECAEVLERIAKELRINGNPKAN